MEVGCRVIENLVMRLKVILFLQQHILKLFKALIL